MVPRMSRGGRAAVVRPARRLVPFQRVRPAMPVSVAGVHVMPRRERRKLGALTENGAVPDALIPILVEGSNIVLPHVLKSCVGLAVPFWVIIASHLPNSYRALPDPTGETCLPLPGRTVVVLISLLAMLPVVDGTMAGFLHNWATVGSQLLRIRIRLCNPPTPGPG